MVLNATFNNISVLLVEETRVPGENHSPVSSHWQILSHNVVSSTHRLSKIVTHNVSDDRHWIIQLPYNHGHNTPYKQLKCQFFIKMMNISSHFSH
jgi:hypothetical protein